MLVTTRGDKGTNDPDADTEALAQRREVGDRGRGACARPRVGAHISTTPTASWSTIASLRAGIVRAIRTVRPDVVCCPDPTSVFFGDGYINHRDHRVTGWAASTPSSPASGNPHYFPELRAEGLDVHQPRAVYLSGTFEPNVWIDIADTLDRKIEALFCHASQLDETGEWFREFLRDSAEAAGRAAGVTYAEGFAARSLIGVT